MNLILAVIVEAAIDSSANEKAIDKEIKLAIFRAKLPKIKKIFSELDQDGSGAIQLEEINDVDPEAKKAIFEAVETDDMEAIFDIVDEDGSGKVDIDEFIHSLEHFVTSDVPLETFRTMRDVIITRHQVEQLKELIEGVHGIGPSRHARGRRSGAGKSSVWPDGSDEDENSFPDFVSQSSKP